MVRTGRAQQRKARGGWSPEEGMAGLDAACLPWLHDHKVAVLGSDGVSDAMPYGYDEPWLSIHSCGDRDDGRASDRQHGPGHAG